MEKIISDARAYIKEIFKDDSSGHDYYHSLRVEKMAVRIARNEDVDPFIVSLAALLHDVDDRKLFHDTYENKEHAVSFLKTHGMDEEQTGRICLIIDQVSYRGTDSIVPTTIEGMCVQDADRLDAIGAIGIARAFAYGGSHNRSIYDPEIKPVIGMTQEEYYNHQSTSINHFYEKLFLLKDLMNTESGKKIAMKRTEFMENYIAEFIREWNGDNEF